MNFNVFIKKIFFIFFFNIIEKKKIIKNAPEKHLKKTIVSIELDIDKNLI